MELGFFPSLLLYVAVFSAASFLAYFGGKKKNRFLIALAIILPMSLASFRYNAGTDSAAYREYYRQVGVESMTKTVKRITDIELEPTIVILGRIGTTLHLGVWFLYAVFALITLIALYHATKNIGSKKWYLYYGLLLFLVFPESLNIMRQIAAVSVQALALSIIIKSYRKKQPFKRSTIVWLIVFATSLHYSSIALLPVFFIPKLTQTVRAKKLAIIMAVVAAFCLVAIPLIIRAIAAIGFMPEKHLDSLTTTGWSLINVRFVMTALLSVYFLIHYSRTKEQDDKTFGFLMMLGVIYSSFGFWSSYFGRFSYFFWVVIAIAIAELINRLGKKDATRMALVLAFGVAYFILEFAIVGSDEIIPYSFAFF